MKYFMITILLMLSGIFTFLGLTLITVESILHIITVNPSWCSLGFLMTGIFLGAIGITLFKERY